MIQPAEPFIRILVEAELDIVGNVLAAILGLVHQIQTQVLLLLLAPTLVLLILVPHEVLDQMRQQHLLPVVHTQMRHETPLDHFHPDVQ